MKTKKEIVEELRKLEGGTSSLYHNQVTFSSIFLNALQSAIERSWRFRINNVIRRLTGRNPIVVLSKESVRKEFEDVIKKMPIDDEYKAWAWQFFCYVKYGITDTSKNSSCQTQKHPIVKS